jgi:hypothetical protein
MLADCVSEIATLIARCARSVSADQAVFNVAEHAACTEGNRWVRYRPAARDGIDASHEFAHIERLGQVIVRPRGTEYPLRAGEASRCSAP